MHAQVFVSDITDGFLLGPENVIGNPLLEAPHALKQVSFVKEQLENLKDEHTVVIEKLKAKRRLRKKNKRKLRLLQAENEIIREELSLVDQINLAWNKIWLPKEILDVKTKYPDKCFLIGTSLGQYDLDELNFTPIKSDKDIDGQLAFDIISSGKKKTWVKKGRDVNCVSSNPKDCLVWCLEDVESYICYDMRHKPYDFVKCPDDSFTFDKSNLKCFKNIDTSTKGDIEKINVSIKESGELVSIFSWEAIDCK